MPPKLRPRTIYRRCKRRWHRWDRNAEKALAVLTHDFKGSVRRSSEFYPKGSNSEEDENAADKMEDCGYWSRCADEMRERYGYHFTPKACRQKYVAQLVILFFLIMPQAPTRVPPPAPFPPSGFMSALVLYRLRRELDPGDGSWANLSLDETLERISEILSNP